MTVPDATYRLQLNRDFTLADARALVPYLDALGISHLYLSPVLTARPGSTHGYDVIDPTRVDPEIGGDEALRSLAAELHGRGMGIVLDIVPNHMAAVTGNPWWRDVLAHGPASPHARFFDVDWERGDGRLLLPVLGRHYGEALEAGELMLGIGPDGLVLRYFDHEYPIDPATWPDALAAAAQPGAPDLQRLLEATATLPPRSDTSDEAVAFRQRESRALRAELWRLYQGDDADRALLDATLAAFHVAGGGAAAARRLDALIERQAYQPAFWHTAAESINYRRFFDIADLVGVRVEEPDVFEATHALILEWVGDGTVDGLRVDHVDGLLDPTGYLRRLRDRAAAVGESYVVVEKILAPDEEIPAAWPVAGTTGYDFLDLANGLFIEPQGVETLRRAYVRATGQIESFLELARREKKAVVALLFAGEHRALVAALERIAHHERDGRDFSSAALDGALLEITACLPVYRTYIRAGDPVSDADRRVIEAAAAAAAGAPEVDPWAVEFIRRLLLDPFGGDDARLDFILRWQQFTGPVMAKGVEDTALYCYEVLTSACEVGGDPGAPAVSVARFHERMAAAARSHPHTMNATSTHDCKRGEDLRVRLDALSELADEWAEALPRWMEWNAGLRREVDGAPAPDAVDEILVYQTLLGAWPASDAAHAGFADRLAAYLTKACREAKRHGNWYAPNEAYEAALDGFARALLSELLSDEADTRFREQLARFRDRLALAGAVSSLSQLLLKATAPGVPDFYQGTELWTLTLVDPDNRRPVDYERRRRLLADTGEDADIPALRESWRDGRLKLFATRAALRWRRANAALFRAGEYLPLEVEGSRREHVVAFARRAGEDWSLTLACRWPTRLGGLDAWPPADAWDDTTVALPTDAPERWRDALTGAEMRADGGTLRLAEVFATLPAALLGPA